MRSSESLLGILVRRAAPCAVLCLALLSGAIVQAAPASKTPDAKAPAAAPDEEKKADPTEEQTATGKTFQTIGDLMLKSGAVGVAFYAVLFIFSLVSLTVALERLFNQRRAKILPGTFKRALRDLVIHHSGNAEEFRRLCETSDTPISRILRAGVLRAGRPLAEIEKAMEDAAGREIADMRGRNRLLYVLGNVGPLIGLMGTVVGMILTFHTAADVGLGHGEKLAEGIYLALLCTAGGLAIAIPSLLVAALLNTRAERLMREVIEALTETTPCFMRMEQSRPQAATEDVFGKTIADFSVPVGEEN